MFDLKKEFSKKSSINFRHKRYKNSKADILIPGGNHYYYTALKPEYVVEAISGGSRVLPFIAAQLGCTNVDAAGFHVETWTVYQEIDGLVDVGSDFFFLIATEKDS